MPTLVSVFGVAPQRIGGTETFARELSVQLGEHGWQSVLCFLSHPTDEVLRFLDLPNISLETFSDSTNGNRQGNRLSGIVSRYRPEILHLHFTGFLSLYPWQARLRSVNKVFFTDHHSRPGGYVATRAPLWKRAAARAINRPLTKVISVSDYGYRCMTAADLLPQSRVEMIYNGVDLSRVECAPQRAIGFRRRQSIPAERAIVVQVSWIIPEKGISDLLETARLVIAQNSNVQFVIVGEGAYREQYMRDAEAMGLGDHVTWTGMSSDPFGEGVFDAADVVCQMSRWEEVFGWMIAEAMAHGKPVVATRVGGIPELIADGASGYLVDRGDAEAASTRVLDLLSDPKLRASMGQAARETVSAKFDLRKNVAQLMKAYGFSQSCQKPDREGGQLESSEIRLALPDGRASDTRKDRLRLRKTSNIGRLPIMAGSDFGPRQTKASFAEIAPRAAKASTNRMSVATLRKFYQPLAIAAALAFVYFTVLVKLGRDWWSDENYSHGLLVPFVIGYIIWHERKRLGAEPIQPHVWLGVSGVVISLVMLWAGVAGAELFVQRISIVVMLASVAIYFRGFRWLRLLAVPLALLLLAIPIPQIVFNKIAFPLQLFASRCAVSAMQLFDISVLRQGNVIELMPLGAHEPKRLAVVEACSGIRSLMTLVTLAVVYAYFTKPKVTPTSGNDSGTGSEKSQTKVYGTLRSLILVVAAVPIAILTNALRVSGTGVLAHYYGTRVADGFFHTFSGWVIYVAAALLLFATGWALDRLARLNRKDSDRIYKMNKISIRPVNPVNHV